MSVKPLTVPVKTLSASIISTSGSFTLNNITGWDGNDLVAANFGTQAFGAFLSADRTTMELFSFDPSTIANTSITFISRGLDFGGLQTNIPANNLDWTANETYVLLGTDTPQFLLNLASKTNDNEFTGVNTFDITPSAGTDPVNPNDLARLSYIQSLILGTLTTIDLIVPGTAGVTIAQGQSIYLDTGTDTWKLTDGTNAATVNNVLLGIAQGAGTTGNPISNGVLLQGVDTHQTGQTGGLTYYASNTPGAISTTPGTNKVALGIAETATKLYFSPRFNQQLTQNQIDALAGDLGSPSSTNKFATQLGIQNRAETTATTTGSSTNTLGTFTVTIANPAVFTLTSHGLVAGDVIQLSTTGALPTGLSAATNYYVIATGLTTNTFEVSATRGGTAITTTGSQSGTQTAARPLNTYEAVFSPVPATLVSGQEWEIITNFTNTGPAGVNINGLGTYNIVKAGSIALSSGDVTSGMVMKLKFDGTNLQLLSSTANQASLAPAFQKISTVVINQSCANNTLTQIATFTGLTGDTDDEYFMVFEFDSGGNGGVTDLLTLRLNNDTTSGHYSYNNMRVQTTVAAVADNTASATYFRLIGSATSCTLSAVFGELKIKASKTIAGTKRMFYGQAMGFQIAGDSAAQEIASGSWTDTSSQITSLQLYFTQSSGSSSTAVGTATLYKMVK